MSTPKSAQPKNEYNFLMLFECLQFLKCRENSVDCIVGAVTESTSDRVFRDLLWSGIKHHFETTNDFDFISKIHKQFKQRKLMIGKESNALSDSSEHNSERNFPATKVFDIENLMCKIFSYLDVISFVSCNVVNKQWLYDSYQQQSIYHLNCDQLELCRKSDFSIDILRFRNVASISFGSESILYSYDDKNLKYFKLFKYFGNISILTAKSLTNRNEEICNDVMNVVGKNNEHLRSITLHGSEFDNKNKYSACCTKTIESGKLLFPNLVSIELFYVKLDCFYLANNLQSLTIGKSDLYENFYRDLINEQTSLVKLKTLKLIDNFVRCKHSEMTQRYEKQQSCYIPKIASKLVNIEEFRYSSDFYDEMQLHWLVHLIGGKLKRLHVTIHFSSFNSDDHEWNDIGSKCDFTNLENATIDIKTSHPYHGIYINPRALKFLDCILEIVSTNNKNCNIKSMELNNIDQFKSLTMIDICKRLDNFKFSRLKHLKFNQQPKWTNNFSDHMQCWQLLSWLDIINNNNKNKNKNKNNIDSRIIQSIDVLQFCVSLDNRNINEYDNEMNRILDNIIKWCKYSNSTQDLILEFRWIRNEFGYQFTKILLDKLFNGNDRDDGDDSNNSDNSVQLLEKENFTLPYYGDKNGTDAHFFRDLMVLDNRIWIKAHLARNARFEFDICIKSKNQDSAWIDISVDTQCGCNCNKKLFQRYMQE